MLSIDEIKQQQRDQLHKLLAWVGTRSRLAHECDVTYESVRQWVERGRISATAARIVEEKTAGLFKKEDLRPDVINWDK